MESIVAVLWAIVLFVEAHPVIAWPIITGIASFAYHKIEDKFPTVVQALRTSGLDAAGLVSLARKAWPFVRAALAKRAATVALWFMIALSLTGCVDTAKMGRAIEMATTIVVMADDTLRRMAEAEAEVCMAHEDDVEAEMCLDEVKEKWAPWTAALDELHAIRCELEPGEPIECAPKPDPAKEPAK